MKKLFVLFASLSLIAPLLFFGCGDDGDTTIIQGAADEGGVPGPLTNTNESCMICHGPDRIAYIFDPDGDPISHDFPEVNLPSIVVDTIVVENVGGTPAVTFHVTSGGQPITSLTNTQVRFIMSDLVPAGTATPQGTWNTPQFARWAYDRTGTGNLFGIFDNTTDSANGNYSYTFARPFGSPSPADNVAPVVFDNTHVQRLYIRVDKSPSYNRAAGFLDFIIPNVGATTPGIGYFERQFVTIDACRKCHGPILANAAHGGGYVDVKACVNCHSPIGSANDGNFIVPDNVALGQAMADTGTWFASLIHKIHAAIPMAEFPDRIDGRGYGAVTFPQDVRNCVTCHTDSGLILGAGDFIDNWKNHPTTNGCRTCHEGFPSTSHDANPVYATNGTAHPGGVGQPDTACSACHPPDGPVGGGIGASVAFAHDTSPAAVLHPDARNVPEFNVTLTLTPPANGVYYVAGDNVLVSVTLTKHSDNTAVDNTAYTSPQGAVGQAGGGLRVASLYFYGPRSLPKPILATQETNLFVSTTNTNVQTDANGFKYRVQLPSGLTAGTYMVRIRIGDYGRVNNSDYKVESIAFRTVQIGTSAFMFEVLGDGIGNDTGGCQAGEACVEPKVAGDTCVNCHGNTRESDGSRVSAPFHDARHIVVWDTDECISCHDYSGGHAATLSNRVHAVHAANTNGDMSNPLGYTAATVERTWAHVTYPADTREVGILNRPSRCPTCHTDVVVVTPAHVPTYRTTIHEVACLGCHGDPAPGTGTTPGPAISHMLQNGGDYPLPAP